MNTTHQIWGLVTTGTAKRVCIGILLVAGAGGLSACGHDATSDPEPTTKVQPADNADSDSDSDSGSLSTKDWRDICGGGACDSHTGLPDFVPGGGLAF